MLRNLIENDRKISKMKGFRTLTIWPYREKKTGTRLGKK
jgi:hypothetical protein